MDVSASVREHVALAPLTTLGIGGPARYFVEADSEDAIEPGLAFADRLSLPVFILGGGSNLLVSDNGFAGLALHVAPRGVKFDQDGESVLVTAGAGEDWDQLVRSCVAQHLGGIECLSGIPGSVGGTPVQNVGAYGQEVSDVIVSVRAFDRAEHRIVEMSREECGFGYRKSIFNTTHRDRFIVLEVTYRLAAHGMATIKYSDLRDFMWARKDPSLRDVREAVLTIRARKGMLLRADDPDSRSAGSFFKNPIVAASTLDSIRQLAPLAPAIPLSDGTFKLSAAWLIEQAGFARGDSRGTVAISTKHTLAIVNRGNATARDVLCLANEINATVRREFDIEMDFEPVMVGFSS
ncbi:MAG: UDP-N-acetylmuramate dehydrogenase [Acidobacteriota bacterium]